MAEPNWFAENAPDTTTADWFAMQDTARAAAPASSTRAGLESRNPPTQPGREWLLDSLPALLGMGGGAIGGVAGIPLGGLGTFPAAVAGAGLGGASGEALRQMGYGAMGWQTPPPLSPKSLSLMAGQGMHQAGSEALGMGTQALARGAAPLMMGAALSFPKKAAIEGLEEGLGVQSAMRHPVSVALEEKISPYHGFKKGGGLEMARSRYEAAGEREALQREAAGRAGRQYTARELAQEVINDVQRGAGRLLSANEKRSVVRWVRDRGNEILDQRAMDFVKRSPGTIKQSPIVDQFGRSLPPKRVGRTIQDTFSPKEVDDILRSARESDLSTLNKVLQGKKSGLSDPSRDLSLSAAGRDKLVKTIPGQEAARKHTQSLRGLVDAMKETESKPLLNWQRNAAIPVAAATGAVMYPGGHNVPEATAAFMLAQLLGNRAVQGHAALALQHPLAGILARQAPRLLDRAIFPPEAFYGPAAPDTTR